MCEFKIINETDGSQIGEDIVVLSYTENNELIIKDILGMGQKLESALIMDINTLNQTCVVLQHPLIKKFIGLVKGISKKLDIENEIEDFQNSLEEFKQNIRK